MERLLGNRYKIIKALGNGGFGETYLAEDMHMPGNFHCVVKHLTPQCPDPSTLSVAQRLFKKEAEILFRSTSRFREKKQRSR